MSSTTDPNHTFAVDTVVPLVNARSTGVIEKTFAATEAQLEVWLSCQQNDAANCAYNEICSLMIHGPLDVSRLKKALDQVVQRHECLRSTFSADGQQVLVHASSDYDFKFVDLTHDPADDGGQLAIVLDQGRSPFDLVRGPLLRVVLQTFTSDHHKLTFAAHHLILDGWSLAVFCRDLGYYYDTLSCIPRDPCPPASQYDAYAEAMESYFDSAAGRADEQFWVDQFSDQVPVLDLPIKSTRPKIRTYYGRRYDHDFSRDLVDRVRKIGAKSGCSLFNTMLAAFSGYVARISGNDDFCVGIPSAGQSAMDQPELIGHCVNTMPLRTRVDIGLSFTEHLISTRKALLDAFDHQRYSYGTLLRKIAPPRDPSRPPMLSVSFNIDPVIDVSQLGFAGLDVAVRIEPRSFENFEWFVNGVIQKDQSIEMQVQYNSDLFSPQSMAFYLEGFQEFLEDLVTRPNDRIADFRLMSISQRQQVIVEFNKTDLPYPGNTTLDAEFAQAAETPDNIAVIFGKSRLTYAEVESQANQQARFLQTQGVLTGDLVGICVERSEQMLVNLLAIMKTGTGYVPLDPAYPEDRLKYMCDHSDLKLIVTQASLAKDVTQFDKPHVALDAERGVIEKLDSSAVENSATPADICYVIYTSGSTGKPKGVQVPHGAVVNFLYAMRQTPGVSSADSVLAVTTLSFDIAVLELYLPTVFGGTVVIVDGATAADGNRIAEQLDLHNISLMQATPSTWRLMIQAGWSGKSDLKVLCGGEPMPADLVAPLFDRCDQLWNMYGPTETTVWSAAFQITNPDSRILIGRPIGNTQIYILDPNGNEVPVGCEGELFIGGAGVTLGYLHRPDLTAERFLENRYRNPFANYMSDRLYRTGDLAKWCGSGNLQFLRRNDKQVKIRGYRIELGEIEQAIKSHPAIEQNVVIVREDSPGDARLAAYWIAKTDRSATVSELRDYLRQSLPHYMIPQHFIQLDAIPQTNNGKINYNALPAPQTETIKPTSERRPQTASEKYLAGVWENTLEIDSVELNDTFFDIGGHSLLVMKVIASVHEKTGIKLGPEDFLMSTLEQLADKIAESFAFKDPPSENLANDQGTLDSGDASTPAEIESVDEQSDLTMDEFDGNLPGSKPEIESGEKKGFFRNLKGFWD